MTTQVQKQLSPLPINKTVMLYSPFEGNDMLVRTGTSENQNFIYSFLHAFLHAHSKDFARSDVKKRERMVKKVVEKIKQPVGDFLSRVEKTLTDLYSHILHTSEAIENPLLKKVKQDEDVYKIIFEILPVKDIFESRFTDDTIEECQRSIRKKIKKKLEKKLSEALGNNGDEVKKEKKHCLSSMDSLMKTIFSTI